LGSALLQNHAQRELVSAELSFVIGGAYLQDSCGDGHAVHAVYYYLKDRGDILGQSADPVLTQGCAESGVGRGFQELILGAHLGAAGHDATGERSYGALDLADSTYCPPRRPSI
jgi:hypothetical protein